MRTLLAVMLLLMPLLIFSGCTKTVIQEIPVSVYCQEPTPEQIYKKDMCDMNTYNTGNDYEALKKCANVKSKARDTDWENAIDVILKCRGEK